MQKHQRVGQDETLKEHIIIQMELLLFVNLVVNQKEKKKVCVTDFVLLSFINHQQIFINNYDIVKKKGAQMGWAPTV